MNRAPLLLLVLVISLMGQFHDPVFSTDRDVPETLDEDVRNSSVTMDSEIGALMANPYRYFRSGRHMDLIEALGADVHTNPSAGSVEGMDSALAAAEKQRSPALALLMNMALYAKTRNIDRARACRAVDGAGAAAFRQLNYPSLAVSIYQLGSQSQCPGASDSLGEVRAYLEHDVEIAGLLKVNLAAMPDSTLAAHANRMEETLDRHPETSLKKDAMKVIGDVNYRLKRFRPMRSWYEKVLALDPDMKKSTAIGYRLKVGNRYLMRQNIEVGLFIAYAVLLIFLVRRIVRNPGAFSLPFFIRKCGLFLAAYGAAASAVLLLDYWTFIDDAMELPGISSLAIAPMLPLSIMDTSILSLSLIILVLGFIPILYVILYSAVKRPYSRTGLLLLTLLLVTSSWTHALFLSTYDDYFYTQSIFGTTRIFLEGEMEKVLIHNPDKALRANPELLNSGNVELEMFLKAHYPDGLP